MNPNEILTKIDTYLEQHLEPNAIRGSIYQDPYKSDFFNFCVEAHQHGYFDCSSNPRLTGDAMKDHFWEKWTSLDEDLRKKKYKLLTEIIAMWDEWHYTLEKIS